MCVSVETVLCVFEHLLVDDTVTLQYQKKNFYA